jgi:glucose dehydrogenase
MTDRHMNCDLDGVFASRNQGQLISSTAQQSKMVRTPGLVPMKATRMGYTAAIPFSGYEQAMAYQGTAGWMNDTTNIPLVGAVSNKVLLGSVAAVGLLAFFLFKKK